MRCEVEIKEISYDEARLTYFKDQRDIAKKRYEQFQKSKSLKELPPMEQHKLLSEIGERLSFWNDIVEMLETDVVPKSEVERLQEEANRYKRYYFRHDYDEMIAEVLDKLDRFINANCIEIKDERGIKGYVTSGVHFAIAELKKKYTEGV